MKISNKFKFTILSMLFLNMVGYTQNLNYEWERSITCLGDSCYPRARSIAIDKYDDIIVAGGFMKADFDPGPDSLIIKATGLGGTFVTKFDKNGSLKWAISIGGDSVCALDKVFCDYDNNIILTGSFTGYIDCDPGPNEYIIKKTVGPRPSFIIKLNSIGEFLWANTFVSPKSFIPTLIFAGEPQNNIAFDSLNNVYGLLNFEEQINLYSKSDTLELFSNSKNIRNSIIFKFDNTGNLIWHKTFNALDSAAFLRCNSLAALPSGELVVTGYKSDEIIDFGQGVTTTSPFFILKMDNTGNNIWLKTLDCVASLDCGGFTAAYGLEFDSEHNLILGGRIGGSGWDCDPGVNQYILNSDGPSNYFIEKLDINGEFIWAKSFGGTYSPEFINEIAIDTHNNIYVTGLLPKVSCFPISSDTIKFKASHPTNPFGSFIYKLDKSGNALDLVAIHGGMDGSIEVNSEGSVYFCMYSGICRYILTSSNDSIPINPPPFSTNFIKFNQCLPSNSDLNISSCNDYTLNGISYNKSGNYTQTLKTNNNCDSIVNLNLTIEPLDTSVFQIGNTLKAGLDGASYQWIDCKTQLPIATMTNQIYSPAANGSYAVIINNGQCSDTSGCIQLTNVATHESQDPAIRIYPNPTKGIIQVQMSDFTEAEILVIDMLGKEVMKFSTNDQTKTIDLSGLNSGLYTVIVQKRQALSSGEGGEGIV